ncbi:MAG: 16S rRNA (uracil(1498)-N(3))-methyltransferase [Lachnospiraceae bacterium]|nr:16S rRNA (uracil(1498)-N(3))-methyltransferase [Lachnospiraceae bacterium]
MQQIFVNQNVQIDTETVITGEDVRHLNKVLRMQPGEILRISTHEGDNYLGEITAIDDTQVVLHIIEEVPSTELKQRIYLFQAIPKGDRMETVIEKAVELGVYEIIPVEMKYCVVKLDDKKKKKRIERYQTIAETAAKQSKRSIIPTVHDVMTYKEAVEYARNCDVNLVPYECKEGMAATTAAMAKVTDADSISIIIGPEGGFADEEIDMVSDMDIISLGKRILRTDTAAIAATTMVMLACED